MATHCILGCSRHFFTGFELICTRIACGRGDPHFVASSLNCDGVPGSSEHAVQVSNSDNRRRRAILAKPCWRNLDHFNSGGIQCMSLRLGCQKCEAQHANGHESKTDYQPTEIHLSIISNSATRDPSFGRYDASLLAFRPMVAKSDIAPQQRFQLPNGQLENGVCGSFNSSPRPLAGYATGANRRKILASCPDST